MFRPRVSVLVPRSIHWAQAAASFRAAVAHGYGAASRSLGAPDLIHAHVAFPAGWAAVPLARRERIPLVVTEHSSSVAMPLRHGYERRRVRETLECADRVIAVGPGLQARLHAIAPSVTIEVVGNVVDTEYFTPDPTPAGDTLDAPVTRPFRIASIGTGSVKGVLDLIAAVDRLRDLPIEVVVGGASAELDSLREAASSVAPPASIRFLGRLDRAGVRQWLRWCDVYVQASREETFGIAIAEAMSVGKGVIVTRSGGPEAFVSPSTGLLVEPGDRDALAAAISEVAGGRTVLDGAAAREVIVDRFGVGSFLAALTRIYDDVLRSSRRG